MNFLSTLTGCFAQPAAENPTVAMVEAAYRAAGLDARYLNCEVAPGGLGDAVRGARAMGWAGFNCSIPHKVAVVDHLDELAPSASIIGAVNCVVRRGDRLVGENTDGQGFLTSLRTVVDPAGADVVVFGAGGAARAITVESALAGAASITVVNRDQRRGETLAHLLAERTPTDATFVSWTRPLPDSRKRRHRRQRHAGGSVPRRRRRARHRPRVTAAAHGRRRRHPEPAEHAPAAGTPPLAAAGRSTASACSSTRGCSASGCGPASTPTMP